MGCFHDQHIVVAVVPRHGLQRRNVGAVVGLSHGEASREVQPTGLGEEPVMMGVAPQPEDGAGEQSELDTERDHQAEVAVAERLDAAR
jgi:hypothetical protein